MSTAGLTTDKLAGPRSVIDSERQQPGADMGKAGDSGHGGTNHGPLQRAELQSVIDSETQLPGTDMGGAWGW